MSTKKTIRGLLYGALTLTALSSIATAGGVSYWVYQNSSIELASVTKPDLTQAIVPETTPVEGVQYDGSVEVTSAEQVAAYRSDTSQPLYLRNYLSVPSLSINLQIYEGTSNRVLSYGAGTVKPDQSLNTFSNYAVAAHNFSDAQWGRGLSVLQYQPDIYGKVAYVSDGEYVYKYTLAAYENVFRDESMKFTEDDYRQQFMQGHIKQLAPDNPEYRSTVKPDRVYNADETYQDNVDGQEFVYGKLLTLYTCYVEWHNGVLESYNRIIVTGVLTEKKPLAEASEDVKALFLDPEGNLTIPEEAPPVPQEAQAQEAQVVQSAPQIKTLSKDDKMLDPMSKWNAAVSKDHDLPEKVLYGSIGAFAASTAGVVVLNLTKGDKSEKEQSLPKTNESDSERQNRGSRRSRKKR